MELFNLNKLPTLEGVYFLMVNAEPVYVGQSTNVIARANHHLTGKTCSNYMLGMMQEKITHALYTPVPKCQEVFHPLCISRLNAVESLFITILRPKCNGRYASEVSMAAPNNIEDLEFHVRLNPNNNAFSHLDLFTPHDMECIKGIYQWARGMKRFNEGKLHAKLRPYRCMILSRLNANTSIKLTDLVA